MRVEEWAEVYRSACVDEARIERLLERVRRLEELLALCDPEGDRLAVFGTEAPPGLVEMCEEHGYGNVMDAAARLWRTKDPVGAYTLGPAVGDVQEALRDGAFVVSESRGRL